MTPTLVICSSITTTIIPPLNFNNMYNIAHKTPKAVGTSFILFHLLFDKKGVLIIITIHCAEYGVKKDLSTVQLHFSHL